ncbi:MAG: hypothetical protein IIB40_07840 [Candidatus Marinimicrobia bacterium]|nr:hypothetical protein [Candidatus Neomarinimicrobiota bacterium]MCH7954524.1 hypothetical protein [Candidatus Neomarinimicrobiota bacterium]
MEYTDHLERAEWEKDEIIERTISLQKDIRDILRNMDESSYEGLPEEKSKTVVNADGTLSLSNSESYIDESGTLILS